MLIVAIDGACRRNGKPDCIAAGGVYAWCGDQVIGFASSTLADYEIKSTSQRGEIKALILALEYASYNPADTTLIITDSEYIFNCMTKNWYESWQSKGWVTASGSPVKNQDLWEKVLCLMRNLPEGVEPVFYHIKGHCISIGKVTAERLLNKDNSGIALYNAFAKRYNELYTNPVKREKFVEAQELSKKNNGYALDDYTLRRFIVFNSIADAVANRCVDAVDSLR